MTDRIELSDAIRSILGVEESEKENCEVDIKPVGIMNSSMLHNSHENFSLANTTWGPCHAPGRRSISGNTRPKRPYKSMPDIKSPPKKRRHINEVIILRNPRRKSTNSPETSAGGKLFKQTAEDDCKNERKRNPCSNSESRGGKMTSPYLDFDAFECEPNNNQVKEQEQTSYMVSQSHISTDDQCSERPTSNQQWLVKKKPGDDSLTNITWLRRMAAPDLDPQTLQISKVSDTQKERPPYSYSTLIQFAISTAPSGRMTLREIYHWIEVHFPYFRTAKLGWRNSIRHNLSLHKIFIREPPVGHGQSAFWTLRPGTVVRLPEKTTFVAQGNSANQSSTAANQMHKERSSHTKTHYQNRGKDDKKRKEPYILPRMTQSMTLVPVPIFISTESGTKLITSPTTGEPILSQIPINLIPDAHLQSMYPSSQDIPRLKKMVKIAPKVTVSERSATPDYSVNHNSQMQSNFPNATFSTSSVLRDSGISTDGEVTFNESLVTTHSQQMAAGILTPGPRECPVNGISSSTPHRKKRTAASSMPDLSIFDELPDFTPLETPTKKDKRKSATPLRSMPCPDWLSPIRGLTPFKLGDDFTYLRDDLNVTPPRTGLTPKNRRGTNAKENGLSTPKAQQRSPALGSLGDLGLTGFTPERVSSHNQSCSKMFGGDMSFDMDTDGSEFGQYWSLMSPPR